MPQIAAAAAAAVTWVSSAAAAATAVVASGLTAIGVSASLATAISGQLLTMAATSLGSFAINAVMAPRANSAGSPISFKADPSSPIRGIMGRFGTAGTQNHFRVWGKNNLFISYSVILSLGPIQGIDGFTARGLDVTFPGAQGAAAIVEPFRDKMWMTYKMGLPTDGALGPPVGVPDGHVNLMTEWTANHKTSGYAGAFWTMKNNSKRASFEGGVPLPNWTVLGQKLYDPRKDSTQTAIGGVGPHRVDDWRTWEYSNNGPVHAINWCLGHHKKLEDGVIDRTTLLAGVGATIDKLDLPTMVAAANVSDANGWTISGEWNTQDDKWQVLTGMLQAGSAVPVHVGSKIGFMVNAPRAAVANITNDDIIGNMNVKVMASRRDRFNTVYPRYISEAQNWDYATAGAVTAATYLAQDDGEERSKEMTYNYVSSSSQAGQLAAYDLANTRETLKVAFPAKPHLIGVKPGDAVTVTSYEHGLDNQKFIVMARPIDLMEGTIAFELRSETDSKHPFALGQTDQPAPSPGLSGLDDAPDIPDEETWTVLPRPAGTGGTSQPGVIIGGEAPDGIGSVLIEYGFTSDGPWVQHYDGPPTTEQIDIAGLEPNTQYYVRITYRSVRAGIPSEPLVLGPYTTLGLISNDSMAVGGSTSDDIFNAIDAVAADADAAVDVLDDRLEAVEFDIDDPENGLKVRVGEVESVSEDAASRVGAVEVAIGAPGTGINARIASLDLATANLALGKADATRVTALEAQAYPAANLLRKSQFQATTGYGTAADYSPWVFGSDMAGTSFGVWAFSDDWAPPGERSLVSVSSTTGTYGDWQSEPIPVKQNTRYCASVFAGILNASVATSVRVFIEWFNEAGAVIGYSVGQAESFLYSSEGKQGGKSLDKFKRIFEFATSPALATQARIYLRRERGSTETYVWFLRPMFSEAAASQTVPPPWASAAVESRLVTTEKATVDLAAGKADASRVTILEARATGSNLLPKAQWTGSEASYAPWAYYESAPNFNPQVRPAGSYSVPGDGSIQISQGGRNNADPFANLAQFSLAVPVEPGKRYGFSVYTGAISCQLVCFFYFIDSVGTYLTESGSGTDACNVAEKPGSNPSSYSSLKRTKSFATAPANATQAILLMRKYDTIGAGTAESYAFFSRMMFGEVPASSTEAPPWAPASLEARLVVSEKVAVDAATQLSTVAFDVIAAAGGDPAQIKVRADSSGSLVQLIASALKFSNTIGGAVVDVMKIIGGNVYITGKLLMGALGQIELDPSIPGIIWKTGGSKLLIGAGFGVAGQNLLAWFGADTVATASMTKANATFFLSSDAPGIGGLTLRTSSVQQNSATNLALSPGNNDILPVNFAYTINGGSLVLNLDRTHTGSGGYLAGCVIRSCNPDGSDDIEIYAGGGGVFPSAQQGKAIDDIIVPSTRNGPRRIYVRFSYGSGPITLNTVKFTVFHLG